MSADLERLAYEAALRALDKQERLVEELRARTGLILAASSVTASLVGRRGIADYGTTAPALLSIVGLVVSIGAAIFVLLPREDLTFSSQGIAFFEALSDSEDSASMYWRAAADLERIWRGNDLIIQLLTQAFSVAALALAIEITAIAVFIGGG